MIFKETMLIRKDDGTYIEVPCTLFDYKTNIGVIKCGIHNSMQPWTDGNCDVSEVTTGRRLCSMPCNSKGANLKIANEAVEGFINEHGVKNVFSRIKMLKKGK